MMYEDEGKLMYLEWWELEGGVHIFCLLLRCSIRKKINVPS